MIDDLTQDAAECVIQNALDHVNENEANPHLLSVQILLPENVDRRLEQRTEEMPGASWPTWGGHITLVPPFRTHISQEEILAILGATCAGESPFTLRFGEPSAVRDVTRSGYYALLLAVEEVNPTVAVVSGEGDLRIADKARGNESDPKEVVATPRLVALRTRLLGALEAVREDLLPQLVAQRFRPHVTLALGLGETEVSELVQGVRAEAIEGEFLVDVVWLVERVAGDPSRFARHPIPLGRPVMQGAS